MANPSCAPTGKKGKKGGYFSVLSRDFSAPAIDLPFTDTYHFRQWSRPPNPWGRRFPITASSAGSAVGAWVWSTKPKTSSSVVASRLQLDGLRAFLHSES